MAELQINFLDACLQLPYFTGIDRNALKSFDGHADECKCVVHTAEAEKRIFHGNSIASIERIFADVVGVAQAERIFTAGRLWKALATGKGSPLAVGYQEMITEAFRWAWGNVNAAFMKLPKPFQIAIGPPTGGLRYSEDAAWIAKLERDGFGLVSDSITKEMLPQIQQLIINGVKANIPAMQLAEELNAYAGSGGMWRIKRLVRTELAMAIDGAAMAQYKAAGIQYVKWNASANACPKCRGIAEANRGYYSIDDVPAITQDTHPNCLCNKTPVYRLPQGVTVS